MLNLESSNIEEMNNQHLKMKSNLEEIWPFQLVGTILIALAVTGVWNQCLT